MRCLFAIAACAATAQACFLTDNVAGQDLFLQQSDVAKGIPAGVNQKYLTCKDTAGVDINALCMCSTNQLKQAEGCDYTWIVPWIFTVQRDKNKFCSQASSGSSISLLSGSEQSMPSSQGSSESGPQLTTKQRIFHWALALCVLLVCCGVAGAAVFMQKSKGKKKVQREQYYDDDQQDYEQQQFDQQYTGPPMTGAEPPADYQDDLPFEADVPPVVEEAPAIYEAPVELVQLEPIGVAPLITQSYAAPVYTQQLAPVTTSMAMPQYMAAPQYTAAPQYQYSTGQPLITYG